MKKAEIDQFINKLTELNLVQLNEVSEALNTRRSEVQAAEKEKLNQDIKEQIKKAGFNVEDFMGRGAGGTPAQKTVKFQDPSNPNNTWGGRGKKPGWLVAQLDAGKNLDSFRITPQASEAA